MEPTLSKNKEILKLPDKTPAEVRYQIYDPSRKYSQDMGDKALELFAQGKTRTQVACLLGVSAKTIDTWCKTYPEFRDKFEVGLQFGQAHWEEFVQNKMKSGEPFNHSAFIFYMSNVYKHDYKQRNDGNSVNIQINQNNSLTPEERESRIKQILDKRENK